MTTQVRRRNSNKYYIFSFSFFRNFSSFLINFVCPEKDQHQIPMNIYYDEEDDYTGNEADEDENSIDDDCIYNETDEDENSIDENETDNGDEIHDDERAIISIRGKNFNVLKAEDIQNRLQDEIMKVSSVLFVPREAATILLCSYNWDVDKVNEEWFADEEKVRKASGLMLENHSDSDVNDSRKQFFCGICLEDYDDGGVGVGCGHLFCRMCWETYISVSINDGSGCLMLRCPQPKCGAAVGQDLIFCLASDEDKNKYDDYLVRSYVEDGKKTIRWCPSPGCDCAVDYVGLGSTSTSSRTSNEVICHCSHGFCWNCMEEAHSPVDCETTANWIEKNSSESENTNWILANTKPCPQCRKPIEKNQGCMHMTCKAPCKFQFCWLCLGPWSEHGQSSGGFYSCNRYESAKESGIYSEEDKKREMAKNSLEKYTHYYERWSSNHSSRKKALEDLQEMKNVNIKRLSEIQGQFETKLKFIIHAWEQIVECRRVLRWTYAYGYYLPEDEPKKKQLFEYMQGEAESALERLHKYTEDELQIYYLKTVSSEEFSDFRHNLINLTGVTGSFFRNLVEALEKDLILKMSCN